MAAPIRVNIPHPNRKIEQMQDDEIDYLIGEAEKTAKLTAQIPAEELTELLQPYAASGEAEPELVVTAPQVNEPAPELSAGEMAAGGARELAGGALFEFADEGEATIRAPFSDQSYDDILREIRQSRARFADAHPGAALALNVAGGIGTMFVPGVNVLGRGLQAATGISKIAAPLGRTAASGSVQGLLAGVGSGEGLEDRATKGLAGAGVGGLLGGAMVGAGRGFQFGRDALNAKFGGGGERAADAAVDILANRISTTEPPSALAGRMELERRYGVPTPLGTASPELSRLTETVLREPSTNRVSLAEVLGETQANASRRAQTQVAKAFPNTPDYFAAEETIVKTLRQNAKSRYGAAYAAAPEIRDPLIREVLNNPAIKSAYQDAQRMSRDEMAAAKLRGEDPSEYAMKEFMDPILDEQGNLVGLNPSGVTVPDLRSLDTVKRALDARITSLYSSGQGGEATALKTLRNAFVERLDEIGPREYKAARAQYKGDIEIRDALEAGRTSNKLRWQQVAKMARDFSDGEKDAFKTGVVQNIMKRFEDTSRSRNFADEIINTPNLRKTLQSVTGPGEFSVLEVALKREAQLFKDNSRVLGGSPTAGRIAEKQEIQERIAAGDVPAAIDLLFNPTPGNLFRKALQAVSNMRDANVSRATFDQLATMLKASSPDELDAVFVALERAAPARADRAANFERDATRAATAGARIIAPSPADETQQAEAPDVVIPDMNIIELLSQQYGNPR